MQILTIQPVALAHAMSMFPFACLSALLVFGIHRCHFVMIVSITHPLVPSPPSLSLSRPPFSTPFRFPAQSYQVPRIRMTSFSLPPLPPPLLPLPPLSPLPSLHPTCSQPAPATDLGRPLFVSLPGPLANLLRSGIMTLIRLITLAYCLSCSSMIFFISTVQSCL